MKLVQQYIIKQTNDLYKQLDDLCFKAKNLYNATLYEVRQYFFATQQYLSYNDVNKLFIKNKQEDYYALPTKVSQGIQRLVEQNYSSFFELLSMYKNGEYNYKPNIPRYLDKTKGRQVVYFNNQAFKFKNGVVKFCGISFKTNLSNVTFVRVVPRNGYIMLELGYEYIEPRLKLNNNYAAIDLGLQNLITLITNTGEHPIIIKGGVVTHINCYYNKKKAKYQSRLPKNKYYSKYLETLTNKRYNKIKTYFHQLTSKIVNYLVSQDISVLVIGYNKCWKQNINLGKKTNQKFVNIPFNMLIDMFKYKCQKIGIKVVLQQESYTSKCSFLDGEKVCKHKNYKGKRIQRGLFKTSKGILINADVNGALNILSKYLLKAVNKVLLNSFSDTDLVQVCSTPLVVKIQSKISVSLI